MVQTGDSSTAVERVGPVITEATWWAVRDQFKRTLPSKVTATYLATVLNQKDESARQVMRALRLVGLLNEDDSPTELASDWRDDDAYASACQRMLEAVYPEELRQVAPAPDPDREVVKSWLMRTRKLGSGAAGNQAATYALIAAADVGGATHRASSGDSKPRRVASNDDQKRRQKSRVAEREVEGAQVAPQVVLQFNLDSSMSEDQVAHFLELAAKHFFSKN